LSADATLDPGGASSLVLFAPPAEQDILSLELPSISLLGVYD
jgi:hypothetical protein